MPELFEKTTLKSIELKNRLVRSATSEGMSDENGFPTQDLYKLYEGFAKGGVGLIITGYAFVAKNGRGPFYRMQGIDSDAFIPEYQKLVEDVHNNGSKIVMQIVHCGRQTTKEVMGEQPMAPSVVKDTSIFVTPRKMTEKEIEDTIEAFGQAARRVKESGFDGVQLHAAHGYLINQFLNPYTNRRKDKWGGSLENRMLFLNKVYARCRELVGADYPILIKMNGSDKMKKGMKPEEALIMAKMMDEMGIDAIEVSSGIAEDGFSTFRGTLPLDVVLDEWQMYKDLNPVMRFIIKKFGHKIVKIPPITHAYNLDIAKSIKAQVNVPVILVGGMTDPIKMKQIINNEEADYISLCRALIANPKFPRNIEGGSDKPSRCIHCNLCCAYLVNSPTRCRHGKRDT